MRIGLFVSDTSSERTGIPELLDVARWAEDSGLATAWVPHIPWSLDALTALALVGQVTSRIELGTAVVPTYPRHPLALAQQALSTQAACDGRLLLGIGPSHPVVVENMHGLSYEKPVRHVREYLDVLDRAFAGPGQVSYSGELYNVNALLDVPGGSPVPIMLAALAPLMLKLAGSRTHGTITWMADERAHAEHVVPRITAAAEEAGQRGSPGRRRAPGRGLRRRRRGSRACRAPVLRLRGHPDVPPHPRPRFVGRPRRRQHHRRRGHGHQAPRVLPRRGRHRPRRHGLRRRRRPRRLTPEDERPPRVSSPRDLSPPPPGFDAFVRIANVLLTTRGGKWGQRWVTLGMMSSRKTAMPARMSARVSPGIIVVA